MNKIKKLRTVAAALALAVLTAFSAVSAFAEDGGVKLRVTDTDITVLSSEIREQGAFKAVQAALDMARYSATEDNVYRVTVEPGEYDLTRSLHIYSNTELYLKGVRFVRNSKGGSNMLRTGDSDMPDKGCEGYGELYNMKITGGVFNGNGTGNTVIKAAHATNLTFDGTVFQNVRNGHIMEIAGVDGFNVLNCEFRDQVLDPEDIGYEAIQLDINKTGHIVDCRSEDIPMKNVRIEGCTFENCPRGIGTHTMVLNLPFDGIKIRNNTFKNMTSAAIQTMNWKNADISGNHIENTPRGIAVYSLLGNGMGAFKSADIAKEGKTEAHAPSSYDGPWNCNITIANNTIKGCGSVKDKYASYEPAGISVIGAKLGKVYSKYDDGSGSLPKGDYSVKGVTVKNNTIDVRGYGIRMILTKGCKVQNNTLSCADNGNYRLNFHGIQMHTSSLSALSGNYVSNAASNGISMYASSVDTISGNELDNSGDYGICCDEANVKLIKDNTIIGTGADGILFKASKGGADITGNYISNTHGRGVFVKDKSSAGKIYGNTIFSCGRDCIEKVNNCKGSFGDNCFKAPQLEGVSLSTDKMTMGKGEKYQLAMTVYPSNAKSKFLWKSSDNSVVSVDSGGRVTAKAVGRAEVTVSSSDGISASCGVEVRETPESISLNETMLTLGQGESFDLNASLTPKNASSFRVKYTSNNEKAVAVSKAGGVITGEAVGTATIVAETFNGKIANCNVIVKGAPYAVWFEEDDLPLGVGESYTFKALMPEDTASNYLVFRSSDSNVVTIDEKSGYACAKGEGTAEITAEAFNGLCAHCTVRVMQSPEDIEFTESAVSVKSGQTAGLSCVFPEGSTAHNIIYSSSDPSVCHVDKNGTVTAKSAGKATVSAETYNGRIAFCEVSVTDPAAK